MKSLFQTPRSSTFPTFIWLASGGTRHFVP
jgi:hypothetical protein